MVVIYPFITAAYILGFYFTAYLLLSYIRKYDRRSPDDIDKVGIFFFVVIWPLTITILLFLMVVPIIFNIVMWPISRVVK